MVMVTALYAGILGLVAIALGFGVGSLRGKTGISLGDGGNRALIVANRRHMNFVENVPLILVLMAMVELNGAPKMWLHVMGGVLVAARMVHPFGIDPDNMKMVSRFIGALGTMLVLLASAVILLLQVFGVLTPA